MIKIIKERKHVHVERWTHDFLDKQDPNFGYTFPVDDRGEYIIEYPEMQSNLDFVLSHLDQVIDEGIEDRGFDCVEPAVGICSCGEEVVLEDQYQGACSCGKCGQWYNIFGQSLMDPEYWDD